MIKGNLKSIDNKSGHYLPRGGSAEKAAVDAFKENGFDATGKYKEVF